MFDVDIDNSKSVNRLKEAIKEKRLNVFGRVDAAQLNLWKVKIPLDKEEDNEEEDNDMLNILKDNNGNPIDIKNDLGGTKLQAARRISYYFNAPPPDMHIQVIVEPPTRA